MSLLHRDRRASAATMPSNALAGGPLRWRSAMAGGSAAVVLNVTVTNPTAASYLTVYPAGQTRPTASNLNFVRAQTIPNLVIARVGTGGSPK